MKKPSGIRQVAMMLGMISLLTIFVIRPARSQDAAKTDNKQTVKIKIIREVDGKTTVIDTTITGEGQLKQEEIQKIVSDLEGDVKELDEDMKEMQMNMEMEWFGSGMEDSLQKMQRKIMIMGDDCRKHGMYFDEMPGGFSYDFNLPGCCDEHGQTLSDLIGDIPMDRVKSYTIKDRKNGKRIIIDIEDAPLMERENRIIIMGNPRGKTYRSVRPDRDVKVIIKTDDREQPEKKEPKSPKI
jgi:hypothetical protein